MKIVEEISSRLTITKDGILLEKTDHEFENVGVFNPAVIQEGNQVHILYRAVREGNHSTIGYCLLDGPLNVVRRENTPLISPQFDYESQGVEDPRIVKIDNEYFLTYTAYDSKNALGALATSSDLKKFVKHGIITPQISYERFKELASTRKNVNEKYFRFYHFYKERGVLDESLLLWDKNLMFYPSRINGKLAFIHRIRPGIQIAYLDDIHQLPTAEFWDEYLKNFAHYILMEAKYDHEASYIGGGCPPILTKKGWLLIYHGVEDTPHGYVYNACAALFDGENPQKEIGRLPYPLFTPELDWEKVGYVNNVVFPTGTALFDDTLYIYYGAADCKVAAVSLSLNELLDVLINPSG
jgi:predicted GH43/DUF377 family glycosyl hydrolase